MATDRKRYNRTMDGNVAYDLNYQRNTVPVPDGGQPYPRPRRQRRTSSGEIARRRMTTRPRVRLRPKEAVTPFAVVGFAIAAVMAVLVLISNVQLNGIYADTVSLRDQLTELQAEGDSLKAEYEEVFNTETLQKAVDKAGNLNPSNNSQIVYVELSDPDNVVVYHQKEESTGIEAFLESVRSLFAGGKS